MCVVSTSVASIDSSLGLVVVCKKVGATHINPTKGYGATHCDNPRFVGGIKSLTTNFVSAFSFKDQIPFFSAISMRAIHVTECEFEARISVGSIRSHSDIFFGHAWDFDQSKFEVWMCTHILSVKNQ